MPFPEPPNQDPRAHDEARARMLSEHLRARGIDDPRVLEAMASVPRERFVSEADRALAYEDRPLSIGHEQTISQPYIVALMTQLAAIREGDRVLEVGTGCGYQTAVLCRMGASVFSVEIVPELAAQARRTLSALGLHPTLVVGDGHVGHEDGAPYDAILVTAAPASVPTDLVSQLAIGGRLVMPLGGERQMLVVIRRTERGTTVEQVTPVRFVPMTGGEGASFSPPQSFDIL